MTTLDIEGVVITPQIHEMLKKIQKYLEHYIETTDDIMEHLLKDKNTPEEKFYAIQNIYYLKQIFLSLIPAEDE
jgi:thiosulfate reductase cytochrome b subunit